jgi:ferredoxin-NADP reductase
MEPTSVQPPPPGEDALELVVSQLVREAEGVVSLVLADPAGRDLPSWEPGAHLDLCLPGVTRQYSLCGDPQDRSRYRLGVLLEPASRGGSKFVHETLCAEHPVTVRPPRNHFALTDAPDYLFIAGGIGITPILPMIAQAQRAGRPWRLVYGGRTRGSMAFVEELAAYGDNVQIRPQDEFGLLDLATLLAEPGETHVYCCGPEPLLAAVEAQCESWPAGRLHVERQGRRRVPAADAVRGVLPGLRRHGPGAGRPEHARRDGRRRRRHELRLQGRNLRHLRARAGRGRR